MSTTIEPTEHTRTAPAVETREGRPAFGTLFMLDVWERFGFYAMTAVLVLYAVAPAAQGGLGWPVADAAALFSVWLALTFMFALPGGWLTDRVLGARRALLLGGGLVIAGQLTLALAPRPGNLAGLLVVAVGTGLYKPSHQTLFTLIVPGRGRREAGISLLYVGIQLSALTAPLVAGYLGERVDWRLAFGSAAAAMAIGTVILLLASRWLGAAGMSPPHRLPRPEAQRVLRRGLLVAVVAVVVLVVPVVTGVLSMTGLLVIIGLLTVVLPIVTYPLLYRNPGLGEQDRRRLKAFLWVFVGWTVFWMLVGQDGSVLNLFGQRATDRQVGGFEVPTSWLQSATPLFILLVAPVFAWLLPRMGRGTPTAGPVKLAVGLFIAGGSFLLMTAAAVLAADGTKVSPLWLLVVYLLHACGELIMAAVGVAAVADALPPAYMSRMIGMMWVFAALGGGLGSQVVRLSVVLPLPVYFAGFGVVVLLMGCLVYARRRVIAEAMAERKDVR